MGFDRRALTPALPRKREREQVGATAWREQVGTFSTVEMERVGPLSTVPGGEGGGEGAT